MRVFSASVAALINSILLKLWDEGGGGGKIGSQEDADA